MCIHWFFASLLFGGSDAAVPADGVGPGAALEMAHSLNDTISVYGAACSGLHNWHFVCAS